MKRKLLVSVVAAACAAMAVPAQAQKLSGDVVKHRRTDRSRVAVRRPVRPGQRGRHRDGRGRLRRHAERQEDRGRQRRPPEQARHRRRQGARVDRPRRRRRDHRTGHLVGGAGGDESRRGQEEARARRDRRDHADHQRGLQPVHRALDLRHVFARQRHRHGDHQAGRQHVVLHHRGLRLRPLAREGHRRGGEGGRRQGARPGAPSAQRVGLLVVPAAGAVVQGQGHRPRERRRRHHQRHQGGERVRPHQERRTSRAC